MGEQNNMNIKARCLYNCKRDSHWIVEVDTGTGLFTVYINNTCLEVTPEVGCESVYAWSDPFLINSKEYIVHAAILGVLNSEGQS